jgi:hypothetical protein
MLALTPIHFIRGRLLLSPLYSIPFVLGWLWSLGRIEQQPTARRVAAACVWLALGMYSYLAAVVMMPIYLVMTMAVAMRRVGWSDLARAAAIFVVCWCPWRCGISRIQSATRRSSARISSTPGRIGSLIGVYWRFFDPSYLFVSGDSSMVNTTRTAGLFPMAFAVLLPIGIVR